MFLKLFLFFTIIPMIELSIFITIGASLGTLNTIILIILTALAGSYLVRREGIKVLYRFQETMRQGILPTEELFDGALIIVAGVLLITPGFLTDIIGMSLIIPGSKSIIKNLIKEIIRKHTDPNVIDTTFKEL